MPNGPQGQRRPADTVAAAIMVAKIATGEIEEKLKEPSGRSRSGIAGGKARAEKLSVNRRSEIAKKAAGARWTGRG
jgi:hypothetical protein